jgi:hypothetical protein
VLLFFQGTVLLASSGNVESFLGLFDGFPKGIQIVGTLEGALSVRQHDLFVETRLRKSLRMGIRLLDGSGSGGLVFLKARLVSF